MGVDDDSADEHDAGTKTCCVAGEADSGADVDDADTEADNGADPTFVAIVEVAGDAGVDDFTASADRSGCRRFGEGSLHINAAGVPWFCCSRMRFRPTLGCVKHSISSCCWCEDRPFNDFRARIAASGRC